MLTAAMPADRRPPRTLLAILVLTSLLLVTVDFRQGDDGPLAGLQNGALSVFAPVQEALSSVLRPVTDFFSSIGELGGLRDENAALERENQELRELQVSVADLLQQNEQLRELVGMQDRVEFTTSAGRVIAQPPGAFRWSVLIDIGSDQGVAENMAVINAEGLVGKVTEVGANHARVQLAASPNAGYFVRVAQTRQNGLLSGRGNRPLQLQIIDDPESAVPGGSDVVTRAFQGTAIPDGIPVGTVVEPEPGAADRAQFLTVESGVDFGHLDIVLVILDAPVVPVDDVDTEEEAEQPIEDGTPAEGTPADGTPTATEVEG